MTQLAFGFVPLPKNEPLKEGTYTVYDLPRKAITAREAMRYLPGFTTQEIVEMVGIQHVTASTLDDRYVWLDEIDVIDRGKSRYWLTNMPQHARKLTQQEYFTIINA